MTFYQRYQAISCYRKPFDIVTNHIHYPIASLCCTIIAQTNITPNMVTVTAIVSELIGVGLILMNFTDYRIAIVLLLQLGWMLDLVDGMLARYKKLSFYNPVFPTLKGYYLDAVSDHVLKFITIGALTVHLAENLDNGWLYGLIAIVIHAITQTEHTLRLYILQSNSEQKSYEGDKKSPFKPIALLMNNIYLFYLVFIPFNRVDLLFIFFAAGELILFIKRIIQFWIADH